jgi:hypothetical protein
MYCYQLRVEGPLKHLDGTGHFFSQKVFRTREAAEAYTAEFSAKCMKSTGANSINDLAQVTWVTVIQLELETVQATSGGSGSS